MDRYMEKITRKKKYCKLMKGKICSSFMQAWFQLVLLGFFLILFVAQDLIKTLYINLAFTFSAPLVCKKRSEKEDSFLYLLRIY